MARAEGLRRIRRIGKVLLWTGIAFVAIAVGVFLRFLGTNNSFLQPISMLCGVIGIYLSIQGVIVLLVVWVVEGFFLAPRVPPNP